jgi:7-alpha-hydroxysteroid dehydrogenase
VRTSPRNNERHQTLILDRFKLDNQVALITGAGRGIGRGISVGFAQAGAKVVCAARTPAEVDKVVAEIKAVGGQAIAVRCDVTEAAELEKLVKQAGETYGRIDIVVNNAGGWPPSSVKHTTQTSFEDAFRFNVVSAFLLSQLAIPYMLERGGAILNISSALSHFVEKPFVVYGTCKAALNHMTRLMAYELAPKVRVNALAVGAVETSALSPFLASGDLRAKMEGMTPLGRIGTPEDVASAALYLCSRAGEWVTGKVFEVDGGTIGSNWPLDMMALGI